MGLLITLITSPQVLVDVTTFSPMRSSSPARDEQAASETYGDSILGKTTHVFFRNGAGSGVLASSTVVDACILERVLRVFVICSALPQSSDFVLPKYYEPLAEQD